MPLIEFKLSAATGLTRHATANDMADMVFAIEPGESIIYACGDVSLDAPAGAELWGLRKLVWDYYETGRGHLTQRKRPDLPQRNGSCIFDYIFTKATPRRREVANA